MLTTKALRYWETLRWLRPEQFYGRVWFRLYRPKPDTTQQPPIRSRSGSWQPPAKRRQSLIKASGFRFLNQEAELSEIGWTASGMSRLWQYNLHYFDDLNAEDSTVRHPWQADIIADWIARNSPGESPGWEPYPTSLRIVNWIKWALSGAEIPPRFEASLAVQARWLSRRLEMHLLGNHLFANAKALVFAGLWFAGDEADLWRRTGFKILSRETSEQFLKDGGHFERSTMYHALALEDVLDLINISRTFKHTLEPGQQALLSKWEAIAPQMVQFLEAVSHPDGEIAFFNDAAFDVAPSGDELRSYASRLGVTAYPVSDTWLGDSGYARLKNGDAVVLCDVAPIGPDYLPGHAHADTLSFEFSLFGTRLFVNSGTSVYEPGAERLRQRGTSAHNTVTIDGRNSSDVWSSFRVGSRARVIGGAVSVNGGILMAEGAHNGYRSLPGRPVHYRRWELAPQSLRVSDRVSSDRHDAEARFYLHPDVAVKSHGDSEGELKLANGRKAIWRTEGGAVRTEPTTWHPEFGLSEPNTCLVLPLENGRCELELSWN